MQKTLIVDNHEPLGINLLATRIGRGVYINQFYRGKDSSGMPTKLLAEKSGIVRIGDFVSTINGQDMTHCTLERTRELCCTQSRPLVITFKAQEGDRDVAIILGDARKVHWMIDFFQKETDLEGVESVTLTHSLYNLIIAADRKNFFNSSKALLGYLTSTLIQEKYRRIVVDTGLLDLLTRLQRIHSEEISRETQKDIIHDVYDRIYPLFEAHLTRFLQSVSASRMFAHFAHDPTHTVTTNQLSRYLDNPVFTAFLFLFCIDHDWHHQFNFYLHYRTNNNGVTLGKMLNFLLSTGSKLGPPFLVDDPNCIAPGSPIRLASQYTLSDAGDLIQLLVFGTILPLFQQSTIFAHFIDNAQQLVDSENISLHSASVGSDKEYEVPVNMNPCRHQHPLEENLDADTLVSDSSVIFPVVETISEPIIICPRAVQTLLRTISIPTGIRIHRRIITTSMDEPVKETELILCWFTLSANTSRTTIIGQPCHVVAPASFLSDNNPTRVCDHSSSLFCPQRAFASSGNRREMHNFVVTISGCPWYGCSYVMGPAPASILDENAVDTTTETVAVDNEEEHLSSQQINFDTYHCLPSKQMSSGSDRSSAWSPIMRQFRQSLAGISNQLTGLAGQGQKPVSNATVPSANWVELHSLRKQSISPLRQLDKERENTPTIGSICGVALLTNAPTVISLRQALRPLTDLRFATMIESAAVSVEQISSSDDEEQRYQRCYEQFSKAVDKCAVRSIVALMPSAPIGPGAKIGLAVDIDFNIITSMVSPRTLAIVFISALLEQKIVLKSSSGYTSLIMLGEFIKHCLYPMRWCHIYAPVIHAGATDILGCPTPFIVGINVQTTSTSEDYMKQMQLLDDSMIVFDVDNDFVTVPEDLMRIVESSVTHTQRQFDVVMRRALLHCDDASYNMIDPHGDPIREDLRRKPISAACSKMPTIFDNPTAAGVVEAAQSFVNNLVLDAELCCFRVEDSDEHIVVFDEEAFLRWKLSALHHGKNSSMMSKEFFSRFIETQAFSEYVTHLPDN